jgi:iron complex outermembrane receptor protein
LAPPGENDVKFHAFTPRASLRYKLGERTNVYASYSKGFRSGGFQPNGATLPALFIPFRPEKITAYEVGFKTANGWLRFDTAAFYYDYKDLQVGVTVPNPVVPGGLINLVSNAPKAEVYGMDAEITAQPIARLNVHAGIAILHARYRNFANATGNGFNIATGLNVTGQVQDWSDIQMARSPKVSGSLGVDYEILDVVGGGLTLAANASYTAGHVLSNPSIYGPLAGALARKQRYRQSGYTLVNLQATWLDADERYKVGVFANNVTNKHYRMTYNGGAFGDYSSWASPRTYGVRLGYNF